MAVKRHKPTSPSMRFIVTSSFEEITKKTPEKSLLAPKHSKAGRNNQGKITVRHQGGGCKQHYRIIDFKRNKDDVKAKVIAIEYDPNRSAYIALLQYVDGEKRYILAPLGLQVNAEVMSGENAEIKVGNALPLAKIPVGSIVHNIELQPGKGGQMARSAGNSARLMAKEGDYVTLKMPSGEMRMVLATCKATLGQVGNVDYANTKVGKAGANRHRGMRPTVRGSAMNPVDHPHGGGEGKCPVGRKNPTTPWGKPALGYKTRKQTKSNRLIVKRAK